MNTRKQVVEGPDGFEAVDEEMVKATSEAAIVVCQCGRAVFKVGKKTATAVSLECAACGARTSVKGPVALAKVQKSEIELAVRDSVISPDPEYKAGKKKGDEVPDDQKDKFVILKFRVLKDAKTQTVDKAFLANRVANTGRKGFEEQAWQGLALEQICADYLSGVDPQILVLVEEIMEESKRLAATAEAEGKKQAAIKRKIREYKQRAREQGAINLGIWGGPDSAKGDASDDAGDDAVDQGSEKKPARSGATPEPAVDDGDDRVFDDGALRKAVRTALQTYAQEYKEESGKDLKMLACVPFSNALKRNEQLGGFLVRVLGDERTRDKSGGRPAVYFWLAEEPPDIALEMDLEYADAFGDKLDGEADLFVTELLPKGYKKLDKSEQWAPPTFCDNREEMKK